MGGKSPRDKCFENELKDSGDLEVIHQRDWVRKAGGTWEMVAKNKWWKYNLFDVCRGITEQWRTPDFTLKTPDGRTLAIDNKYGNDDWSKKKGMGGFDQREDQNEINRQQNPGRKDVENLQLNEDNCECKGKNKPDAQTVEQLNLVYYPNLQTMQAMVEMMGKAGSSIKSGVRGMGGRVPIGIRLVIP